MDDNTFKLDEEQKRLCHELTMEFIHQNNLFKMEKPNENEDNTKKSKRDGSYVRKVYFDAYEEIAIGIVDNWERIQKMYH